MHAIRFAFRDGFLDVDRSAGCTKFFALDDGFVDVTDDVT